MRGSAGGRARASRVAIRPRRRDRPPPAPPAPPARTISYFSRYTFSPSFSFRLKGSILSPPPWPGAGNGLLTNEVAADATTSTVTNGLVHPLSYKAVTHLGQDSETGSFVKAAR
ncbi:hypothetical protein EVAR_5834_1 [Eumeta japonica]|uniref:Uncharacterized protein n=1 Tax=Eumeta variegata TaxID=151549 RepID=A0A4C1TCQ7_EUMVA|nr:hypothetical protein EVAR_5834_1 [Eumeta japonica]